MDFFIQKLVSCGSVLVAGSHRMLASLIVFLAILIGFWYWKSCRHPKGFPPGPRRPIPVFGDAYVLGNDLAKGFSNLSEKYGKVCGFWLGRERAVFVADFDLLQDILQKSETVDRQTFAVSRKLLQFRFSMKITNAPLPDSR